ncbi:MAG TPA: beta-ketoacyl-[acyl-carrier-protein] synthase family protein [Thermodesulfovibrionales bacterium]|nr:beta-ketoacyl-[acyl-carrier-protein] synthase family protein [Thermodesulfovibrionales bacterium]
MDRKVVITGSGIISPVGIGKDIFLDALFQGKTGFTPISLFDATPFHVRVAGEIRDFDPVPLLGKKGLRSLDRSTLLICSAARLALDDSRTEITENNSSATGVAIGTTFGSLHSISQFDRVGLLEGPRFVNPSHFPNTVINSPASQVSIRFRIRGFNTTISTGFCASLDAMSYAADFIKLGRADVVLAGGVEELCEETFLAFHTMGCVSGADGSEPLCCPFDARRNGTILSEGAAVMVLEHEDHALSRGAEILAVIRGYGNAFDSSASMAFNQSGKGLRNAITLALKDARLSPKDIDYVAASANSTKGLDRLESKVIREFFGEHADSLPVSSIKSMVGESFSASGAMSLAAGVGAIQKGLIPPTVNYKERDPDCDLDYVPNTARQKDINNVLVISADPYGNNSAVVIGEYDA